MDYKIYYKQYVLDTVMVWGYPGFPKEFQSTCLGTGAFYHA